MVAVRLPARDVEVVEVAGQRVERLRQLGDREADDVVDAVVEAPDVLENTKVKRICVCVCIYIYICVYIYIYIYYIYIYIYI